MRYLIDTSVLLRIHDPVANPHYVTFRQCLETLWEDGHDLCYTVQNLAEFWNVSTRPAIARGGLGVSLDETDRRARIVEQQFTLLIDNRAAYDEWRRLLVTHGVMGVQVHDARLVAAMLAHGVTHLLTMNDRDFRRYQGITVVTPDEIVHPPAAPSNP